MIPNPTVLIGLKEDAVMRMLSRLGVPHRVQVRDGITTAPSKNNKSKLRLEIQAGTITKAYTI